MSMPIESIIAQQRLQSPAMVQKRLPQQSLTSSPLTEQQQLVQMRLLQQQIAVSHGHPTSILPSAFTSLKESNDVKDSGNGNSLTLKPPPPPTHTPHARIQYYDDDQQQELAYVQQKRLTIDENLNSEQQLSNESCTAKDPIVARLYFDAKRRMISRLTLNLIMTLTIDQIRAIRSAFDKYTRGVNVAEFVSIMTTHLYSPPIAATTPPSIFMHALIELFEAMDLDGDRELEWEELLSTIVHMGMGATDHLVLSPINPYQSGPVIFHSKQNCQRFVTYHPDLSKLIITEVDNFRLQIVDPSMCGQIIAPQFPIQSVLCAEYVHGLLDDEQSNELFNLYATEKRNRTSRNGSRKSELGSTIKENQKIGMNHKSTNSRTEVNFQDLSSAYAQKVDSSEYFQKTLDITRNDRRHNSRRLGLVSNVPVDKAPVQEQSVPNHPARISASLSAPSHVSTVQELERDREKERQMTIVDPHSEEVYYISKERKSPIPTGNDDILLTATAHYLSLWEGLPNSTPVLQDSKKLHSAITCLYWCRQSQRVYSGDLRGHIYEWKIIHALQANPFSKQWTLQQRQTKCKLVRTQVIKGHTDIITSIVTIPTLGFLFTASMDHSIRMWEMQTGKEKNVFLGHRAGVVQICYSQEYRFLLSASLDHDVCVWSPFAHHVVFKLVGHTFPLVGVQFIPNTPQIVTADIEGNMKIWDARNFTCVQTFMSLSNLTSFTTCGDRHARIVVVGKSHNVLVFDQQGGPYLKATDDDPVYTSIYSTLSFSFLTCNRSDIKIWNALNGRLSRIYRGLSDTAITMICLDARQRKLFAGDKEGKIRVYNALTGAYMKPLSPHGDEIIFLKYIGSRRELVSASADRRIKVHDERPIEDQVVILDITLNKEVDIVDIGVNEASHTIAVASTDGMISTWNIDHGIKDNITKNLHDVMSSLCYLEPYPLVVVGDEASILVGYYVRPSHIKGEVAFAWRTNKDNEEWVGTISALHWDPEEHVLLAGNIHGQVFAYPLKELITLVMNDMEIHQKEQYQKRLLLHQQGVAMSSSPRSLLSNNTSVLSSPAPPLTARLNETQPLSPKSKVSWLQSKSKTGPIHARVPSPTSTLAFPSLSALSKTKIIKNAPYVKEHTWELLDALRPRFCLNAHSHAIISITSSPNPKAFITSARTHKVKIWSMEGGLLGVLDSQHALAQTYAPDSSFHGGTRWQFECNVFTKEQTDRESLETVLTELEQQTSKKQKFIEYKGVETEPVEEAKEQQETKDPLSPEARDARADERARAYFEKVTLEGNSAITGLPTNRVTQLNREDFEQLSQTLTSTEAKDPSESQTTTARNQPKANLSGTIELKKDSARTFPAISPSSVKSPTEASITNPQKEAISESKEQESENASNPSTILPPITNAPVVQKHLNPKPRSFEGKSPSNAPIVISSSKFTSNQLSAAQRLQMALQKVGEEMHLV